MYSSLVRAEADIARLYADRDRLLFDIWRAQVDVQIEQLRAYATYGEIIRAQAAVIDANARAYQAEIQGKVQAAQLEGTIAKLNLESAQIQVSLYDAAVRAEAARVQALAQVIRTKAAIYTEMARFAIEKARAEIEAIRAEASINAALQQSAAAAYQARASAHAADANAAASMMNAHAAYINVVRVKADSEVLLYRATLESIIAAYRAHVEAFNSNYIRTLTIWSDAMNRGYRVAEAVVNKYAAMGQISGSAAASALNGTFVSMQVQESAQMSFNRQWLYRLSNSLVEQYSI
jgi:uncharacterized membrane protein YqiK